MRRLPLALKMLLPAMLLAASPAAAPVQALRMHADLSLRVNAVYHAACLSESIACSRELFDRFWKSRLSWSQADQAAIATWRRVMASVTAAAPPRAAAPFLPNTPRFHPAQAARTGVIVALIEATSAADLQAKSQAILSQEDAAELGRIVGHFEQRLKEWFSLARGFDVPRRIQSLESTVRSRSFASSLERMAAFLQSTLPAQDLYVHVIAGPEPSSEESSATQLGSHLLVEAVNGTTIDGIASGAVHELTHYLYDCAPAERHRALIDQFAQSGSPQASALYTYLNEAVAVAAQAVQEPAAMGTVGFQSTGTVIFQSAGARMQTKKDEGYRHPYIAPLGAAVVPLVKEAVERKRTLFDGFATRYITAGTAALKPRLTEPQFTLAQVGLMLPADGDSIRTAWMQAMFPQASAAFSDDGQADDFPDLHIVRFVRYAELPIPGVTIPDLKTLVTYRAFAYALPRGPRATTYVLAGRDNGAIVDAIRKLATLTTLPSKGTVLTVDGVRRTADGVRKSYALGKPYALRKPYGVRRTPDPGW